MKTLLTLALSYGFTLSSDGGAYKVDHRKACIDDVCTKTGEILVLEDGLWQIPSINLEIRWVSTDRLLMRRPQGPWQAGRLTSTTAGSPPWKNPPMETLAPGWEHGVLPGLWYEAHYHCEKDTMAWTFRPVVKGVDGLIVRRVGEGWALTAGSNDIVKCVGAFGGISEPKR